MLGYRLSITAALAAIVLVCIAVPARAGLIMTSPTGGGHLISAHSPIGQSFTAQDPLVSVGLYIYQNSSPSGDHNLLARLFAGHGVGGTLVDQRTVTLPDGFNGYFDIDYSNLALLIGQPYTAVVSSSAARFVSSSTSTLSPNYPGGFAVVTGSVRSDLPDKAFRVTPIPEPVVGLAGAAAVGTLVIRRQTLKR